MFDPSKITEIQERELAELEARLADPNQELIVIVRELPDWLKEYTRSWLRSNVFTMIGSVTNAKNGQDGRYCGYWF